MSGYDVHDIQTKCDLTKQALPHNSMGISAHNIHCVSNSILDAEHY